MRVSTRRYRPGAVPATVLVLGAGAVALAIVSAVDLAQGAADVGWLDAIGWFTGTASERADAVLGAARLPRVLAGVVSGGALGMAGALLQAVSRNDLAAPETLGVNAGAYFAVVATTAFGVTMPIAGQLGTAFTGGLGAATLVTCIAAGVRLTPTRLILAGVSVTLALSAATDLLLLLHQERTLGLFLWGQGTLLQVSDAGVRAAVPRLAVGLGGALLLARHLDVYVLDDTTARGLGLRVGTVRILSALVAILLSATAVALTGPIGFVGLSAPHLVRLAGVRRHLWVLLGAALWGAVMLLGADAVVRGIRSTALTSELPATVATAIFGAPFFVWLARRAGYGSERADDRPLAAVHRRSPLVVGLAAIGVLLAAFVAALSLGDLFVNPAQLSALLLGEGDPVTQRVVLELRLPRAVTAALAGACLASSGLLLQAVSRNPLAAPSIVGVTGGATLGALTLLLVVPGAALSLVPAAAFLGGAAAFVAVYVLAWRGGVAPGRLLLVGVAMTALTSALSTWIVVGNQVALAQALTWLSGSTYARGWGDVIGLAIGPLVLLPIVFIATRHLDVLMLGDELPVGLGLPLQRTRVLLLGLSVALAAAAVATVGAITFVGLVGPHAARQVAGGQHRRLVPVTAAFGAALVVVADTFGRTVIAPAEIPSGLVTAMIGAPYFIWLLWRSRRVAGGEVTA